MHEREGTPLTFSRPIPESLSAALEVEHSAEPGPEALIERARQGSVEAFERLYRENVGRVYALCLRLSGDVPSAEELTQDVFVLAWRKLASFRGDSAFSTWLHRLTVNLALGRRRSDTRRGNRILLAEDLAIFDDGSSRAFDPAARIDLETAMTTLPEAARTVFVMHEVEGYTHDEIGRMTGRAEGTCKALLHRARKLLRQRLER
jgi:RNA polymerase sigma-70 factor (ECF subfamily)